MLFQNLGLSLRENREITLECDNFSTELVLSWFAEHWKKYKYVLFIRKDLTVKTNCQNISIAIEKRFFISL